MNNITIVGNIAKGAELRSIPSGDQVAAFSVADNQIGKDKSAIFWNCQLWGKRAASLVDYLQKGQSVTVVGTVSQRAYTDKNGQERTAMEVRVQDVALQGGKREEAPKPAPALQAPSSAFDDQDCPF
jgi:single-strand DNA-binding protein